MASKSVIYSISDEEFRDLIERCGSYSDCLREFGLHTGGGGSRTAIKERVRALNIDVSHFRRGCKKDNSKTKIKMQDILVKNSTYKSRAKLKERLIRDGYLEYKCAICGISKWRNMPIALQLHHIDGISNNHELSNIQLLCPNCHSQTDTYAGKNGSGNAQKLNKGQ